MTSLARPSSPSDPLNVLAYADSAVFSGAESVFVAVCAELRERGVTLTCAAPRGNTTLWNALQRAGASSMFDVPAQGLSLAALRLWAPRPLGRLRRRLRHDAWDAVLVNLPSAEYGGRPLLARPRGGAPTVGLLHVHVSPHEAGFRLGRVRAAAAWPVLRRVDRLLPVAPGVEDELARLWGVRADRLGHLPLPAPAVEHRSRAAARNELGLDPEVPVISMIGRLTWRQKGHDVLIEAAEQVLRVRPDVVFAVAGDGPDRAAIERLVASAGIGSSVRLLGALDSPAALFAASDALAIPSRFEGLPLVAMEAVQAGVLGVASDVDGLRALWPSAWRVPPSDPTALAEALLRYLDADQAARDAALAAARGTLAALTAATPGAVVLEALEGVRA